LGANSPQLLLDQLESLLVQVKERYGIRVSLARFLSVLAQYPCIPRCLHELTPNGNRESIDVFYLDRHNFLVRFLVNRLAIRLKKEGIKAEIRSESKTRSGAGDVDVIPEDPPSLTVRIEVKGGQGIGIDQILRYLAENSVLILCLAGRGEALLINRNQLTELLNEYLKTLIERANSLLDGVDEKLVGPWCAGCPLRCPHAHNRSKHRPDLWEEFILQNKNWMKAINKTIDLVVELLKQARKTASRRKQEKINKDDVLGGDAN